jgi:hypothetical protein
MVKSGPTIAGLFTALLATTSLAGCMPRQSERAPVERFRVPLEMAPRPTDQDTGGKETDFYLEYVLEGGDMGAVQQVLVITTNKNIGLPKKPTFVDDNFENWGEFYVVPKSVAREIEQILEERGFFASKSIPTGMTGQHKWNAPGTDGYQWTLTAKTPQRRHRVIICYVEIPRPNSRHAAVARKAMDLVPLIRELAASKGELIEKSAP